MSGYGMPPAERQVSARQALAELARVRPELAAAAISELGEGWDNFAFRVAAPEGGLVLRFPRRRTALQFMEAELRWLPELAPRLSLPTSVPLVQGVYEGWPWAGARFHEGDVALGLELDELAVAEQLLVFFDRLHRPAPAEASHSPFRSEPLSTKRARVHELCQDPVILELFEAACALPGWERPPVWIHGDLHPLNVVVRGGGRLAAVIYWGDVCAGDPAVDLCFAWMVLGPEARARIEASVDPLTWGRARGWAVFFGCVYQGTELEETGAAMLRTLAASG